MNNQEKNTITDNRIKIHDSYVLYKTESDYRAEFGNALSTKGLSIHRFADAFSNYLDKVSQECASKNQKASVRKTFCKEYLDKKGRKEMTIHGDFDWGNRFKKFSSGQIIALTYGEVVLIKKCLSEFPDVM